ncbi:ABC transporter substrate-binding protein [Pantoea sp. 1.19]|uniref:peptide ABC transporter substrate-binding protein n=1 Tax=Pantoea sp. 1.19 TaxID=1925589 RepID=UPI00352A68AF
MDSKLTSPRMALATLLLSLSPTLFAAEVPPGTRLAAQQEIVRGNGAEPSTLDPQKVETNDASNIIVDLFDGLVQLDRAGKPQPGLAASWDNRDNRVWTFHLRPNLQWSDGTPLTAHDVVFSWRRLADPKTGSPYASFVNYAHLEHAQAVIDGQLPVEKLGVTALDDSTVQVTLSQPVGYFLQFVAHTSLFPVSEKHVRQYGDSWTRPGKMVSSGAYSLDDWVVNEKIVLTRNPRYWNNDKTVIERVSFLPIADAAAEVNRFRSGEIGITSVIPAEQYAQMQQQHPDEVVNSPVQAVFYYQFNTEKAPFNDVRVRQALNLAIDKNIIAQKVTAKGQLPADAVLPLTMGEIHLRPPAWAAESQDARTARAKALLAEAGFTAAHPLRFTLLYNIAGDNQRIAIAVASMWKKTLGAQVKLQNQEWKTMVDVMHSGQFDVVRYTWGADYDEPSSFLNTFRTGDSQNLSRYRSQAFDEAVAEAGKAATPAGAQAWYQKASDIIGNDMPVIPIVYSMRNQLVRSDIGGFWSSPMGLYFTRDLYVKAR